MNRIKLSFVAMAPACSYAELCPPFHPQWFLEPFSKLRTLPFLGDPVHRQTTHDAQAWAESVCVRTPVRICEPLGNGKGFWFDSEVIRFGAVWVVSPEGSAITLSTEQHHSAQLLLPYQGLGSWKIGRDVIENSVGESILYLSQAPCFLTTT
jgi:hypothetical protein